MIKIKDLSINFNSKVFNIKALKKINLHILEGDFIVVIGSNGAGKSCLLKAISGEYGPSSGRIFIDGEDVSKKNMIKRAAYIAKVSQAPLDSICTNFTIAENMAFAQARGVKKDLLPALNQKKINHFKDVLKNLKLKLDHRILDSSQTLSGGQMQALALIMASLQSTKILLLDEHTSALDPRMAKEVLRITNTIIKENNLTALMITHSIQTAIDNGNRTIMLHEGRIIFDLKGRDKEKLTFKKIQDLFLSQVNQKIDDEIFIT